MLSIFCWAEHEAAMVKYSRLPKKRENEKVSDCKVVSHLLMEVFYQWSAAEMPYKQVVFAE